MAIALVDSVSGSSTLGNDFTTAAIDTTGADFLVAVLTSYTGLTTTVTLSDSKGNTWTPLTHKDSGDIRHRIYYATNPTVGTGHTFSVAAPSPPSVYGALCVAAYSGVDTTDPFDQENGATASGATSIQTGSVTPSEDNELLIAGGGLRDVSDVLVIDSSFTIAEQVPGDPGDSTGASLAYLVQTTAAAANPTWSWTNSNNAAAAIATFKAAAAGGTTAPWYHNLQMAG